MQESLSDDDIRKRLLEKPHFELAAKDVFILGRCYIFRHGVTALRQQPGKHGYRRLIAWPRTRRQLLVRVAKQPSARKRILALYDPRCGRALPWRNLNVGRRSSLKRATNEEWPTRQWSGRVDRRWNIATNKKKSHVSFCWRWWPGLERLSCLILNPDLPQIIVT